jgi:hypothetical protein
VDKAWFLEGVASDGSRVTHPLHKLPYRVGRDTANDLSVDARGLSRQHAEFCPPRWRTGGADLTAPAPTSPRTHQAAARAVENDVVHPGNADSA